MLARSVAHARLSSSTASRWRKLASCIAIARPPPPVNNSMLVPASRELAAGGDVETASLITRGLYRGLDRTSERHAQLPLTAWPSSAPAHPGAWRWLLVVAWLLILDRSRLVQPGGAGDLADHAVSLTPKHTSARVYRVLAVQDHIPGERGGLPAFGQGIDGQAN